MGETAAVPATVARKILARGPRDMTAVALANSTWLKQVDDPAISPGHPGLGSRRRRIVGARVSATRTPRSFAPSEENAFLPIREVPRDVEMGTGMSLDAWLAAMQDRSPSTIVTYQFPTDGHRSEYLQSIGARSDRDVRRLLRKFLMPSGMLGADNQTIHFLAHRMKTGGKIPKTEFTRRLFCAARTKGRVQPWEGSHGFSTCFPKPAESAGRHRRVHLCPRWFHA